MTPKGCPKTIKIKWLESMADTSHVFLLTLNNIYVIMNSYQSYNWKKETQHDYN